MKYIKQLDSVRAVAVFSVILWHWLYALNFVRKIPFGEIGVDIFFVLSGFLITTILFESRIKSEQLNISKATAFKNFYIKRILRIFPIYYMLIFVLFIFQNITGTSSNAFPYLLTYTTNFYFFKIQGWDQMIAHLWSLAVEEQYYLIWPCIILFTNKKYLFHVIVFFILAGIISQYLLLSNMSFVITPTCFDAFGLGALLSWQTFFNSSKSKFYNWLSAFAFLSLILFVISLTPYQWLYIPVRILISIMALWLITYIVAGKKTKMFKILDNRFLIFTGKISYGMYLYHLIIPGLLNSKFINKYFNPYLPEYLYKKHWGELYFTENIVLLFLISFLSYKFIEKPFLELKKYFDLGSIRRLSPKKVMV